MAPLCSAVLSLVWANRPVFTTLSAYFTPAPTPVTPFDRRVLPCRLAVPMMGRVDYNNWFKKITGGASLREAADRSGISKSTLSRNIDADAMTPETVISLCRGYGRSPVTGLVETGYLQPWELDGVSVPYALQEATNEQLLDEVMRRSDPEARQLFTADADEDVVDIDDNIVEFPSMSDPAGKPGGAAADSSPDEDALREEGDWTDPDNIP